MIRNEPSFSHYHPYHGELIEESVRQVDEAVTKQITQITFIQEVIGSQSTENSPPSPDVDKLRAIERRINWLNECVRDAALNGGSLMLDLETPSDSEAEKTGNGMFLKILANNPSIDEIIREKQSDLTKRNEEGVVSQTYFDTQIPNIGIMVILPHWSGVPSSTLVYFKDKVRDSKDPTQPSSLQWRTVRPGPDYQI